MGSFQKFFVVIINIPTLVQEMNDETLCIYWNPFRQEVIHFMDHTFHRWSWFWPSAIVKDLLAGLPSQKGWPPAKSASGHDIVVALHQNSQVNLAKLAGQQMHLWSCGMQVKKDLFELSHIIPFFLSDWNSLMPIKFFLTHAMSSVATTNSVFSSAFLNSDMALAKKVAGATTWPCRWLRWCIVKSMPWRTWTPTKFVADVLFVICVRVILAFRPISGRNWKLFRTKSEWFGWK